MAHKSGFSHALAALVGLIAGDLLLVYLRPTFPLVAGTLEKITTPAANLLGDVAGVKPHPGFIASALVACVLAFAWGAAYHLVRHGRGD